MAQIKNAAFALLNDINALSQNTYLQILYDDKAHTAINHEGINGHPLAQYHAVALKSQFKSQLLGIATYACRQIDVAL